MNSYECSFPLCSKTICFYQCSSGLSILIVFPAFQICKTRCLQVQHKWCSTTPHSTMIMSLFCILSSFSLYNRMSTHHGGDGISWCSYDQFSSDKFLRKAMIISEKSEVVVLRRDLRWKQCCCCTGLGFLPQVWRVSLLNKDKLYGHSIHIHWIWRENQRKNPNQWMSMKYEAEPLSS